MAPLSEQQFKMNWVGRFHADERIWMPTRNIRRAHDEEEEEKPGLVEGKLPWNLIIGFWTDTVSPRNSSHHDGRSVRYLIIIVMRFVLFV